LNFVNKKKKLLRGGLNGKKKKERTVRNSPLIQEGLKVHSITDNIKN